jgi:hypothetical protein
MGLLLDRVAADSLFIEIYEFGQSLVILLLIRTQFCKCGTGSVPSKLMQIHNTSASC